LKKKNKWPTKCPKCGSTKKVELVGGWRCGKCTYIHLEVQHSLFSQADKIKEEEKV